MTNAAAPSRPIAISARANMSPRVSGALTGPESVDVHNPQSAISPDTTSRIHSRCAPAPRARPAPTAPTSTPTENMPCASGIRRLPLIVSIRAALAFTATSIEPVVAPVTASVRMSHGSEAASPGNVVAAANAKQVSVTARTPKRSTSGPAANSIVGIAASVMKSSASPSVPFERCVALWTLGSTAAQAPQKRPSAANAASVGPLRGPVGPGVVPPAAPGVEVGDESPCFGSRCIGLILREATLADANVEQLVVLQLEPAVGVDDEVELEILRVEAVGAAAERLLEVDVPARERALGAFPEGVDGVGLARALQHERPVTAPAGAAGPWMLLGAGRERERRALGDVGREQLVVVAHDDYRDLEPHPAAVPHLAADDDVALRPHASRAAGRAASTPPAAASP